MRGIHLVVPLPVNGGGAWEADREYTGWSWLLVREEDGGDWELLTAGYA